MRRITSPVLAGILSLLVLVQATAFAGITFIPGQGYVLTGADGVLLSGAQGYVLTGADGLALGSTEGFVLTGTGGYVLTGADALTYTGIDGSVLPYLESAGLRSLDPELAMILNRLPNTSSINVCVVFHRMPTEADLNDLRRVGVLGGTRFHNLPMVVINATKTQMTAISALPSVRSLYSNKTIEFLTHDTRAITGQSRVISDTLLTSRNAGLPLSGRGITVAVLDTGIDGTHPDLRYPTKVIDNVRVLDLQGSAPGVFLYPTVIGGLPETDLVMGHGTLAAGIVSGTSAASSGYYGGIAPGASLLGVSVGDVNLFFVLSGIDYILSNRVDRNIRVVNCSFGISGLFDFNDPVNIATRIMHDAGISVVFSAGNRGDQPNSLNPYSVADWVIGVGSGTKDRRLSGFSSRGAAGYGIYHPTLIAPGENVVSARAIGINVVGTAGLAAALISPANDLQSIPLLYLPRYTMSSGTSFAAPHVAATIALMLEAAPQLRPDQIKRILQETATPMLGYSRYEVGAGYLNTYAAVRKAAFGTPFGQFRSSLASEDVSYDRQPLIPFNGQVAPGSSYTTTFQMPDDAAYSTLQVAWVNGVGIGSNLKLTASRGAQVFDSKPVSLVAGQGVQKTGVTLNEPEPGEWTLTVRNIGGLSTQSFAGAIEVMRASYSSISDTDGMSALDRQAVKRAVRTGLVACQSGGFLPNLAATRLELARAVALGAGGLIPQQLPYSPSFVDVPADENAVFIESVVNSPRGNLMGATGSLFRPQAPADRLTVAIAVVKALGLQSQANAAAFTNPGLADWNLVPLSARGYVSVAVVRNLVSTGGTSRFRPFDSVTRAELASTASALRQAAR